MSYMSRLDLAVQDLGAGRTLDAEQQQMIAGYAAWLRSPVTKVATDEDEELVGAYRRPVSYQPPAWAAPNGLLAEIANRGRDRGMR